MYNEPYAPLLLNDLPLDPTVAPPSARKPMGRPKGKRIESIGENVKRIQKCLRCGLAGHKSPTCTNPPLLPSHYTVPISTNLSASSSNHSNSNAPPNQSNPQFTTTGPLYSSSPRSFTSPSLNMYYAYSSFPYPPAPPNGPQ